MTTRIADHITLVTETKQESGAVYKAKGRAKADVDNHPTAVDPKGQFSARVNAGSGWVKLYDVSSGLTLLEVEVTNTTPQDFDISLVNWPAKNEGNVAKMECQIKSDGVNTISLYEFSVEVI